MFRGRLPATPLNGVGSMATASKTAPAAQTIEWAEFRLASGVDENSFMRASDALQHGFLSRQTGFVRRELARDSDRWVDIVYWESAEAVGRAMQDAPGLSVCQDYFRLIVVTDAADGTPGLRHFRVMRSYQ